MERTSIPGPSEDALELAVTREELDRYLAAVTAREAELETEIRTARARRVRAQVAEERITALERAVGSAVVAAFADAQRGTGGELRDITAVIDLREEVRRG